MVSPNLRVRFYRQNNPGLGKSHAVPQIITEPVVRIEERSPLEREALGTDKNPIPVLWRAHPRGSPGRMVQLFKRMTARAVFRRRPGSKQELWGGEFWSEGLPLPQ
ncbi:MAG: transposase [Nitrospirales bacterium]|nr:transposase [Nitrospirales bacterium]